MKYFRSLNEVVNVTAIMSKSLDDVLEQVAPMPFSYAIEELRGLYIFIATVTNQCIPINDWYEPSALNDPPVQVGFGLLYGLIWLLGVVGNCLVLAVLISGPTGLAKPHRYNAFAIRSVFVASLSCSDLLVALTSLPVTAFTLFAAEWVFPEFLCHCIGFFQAFSIFQSSFTFVNLTIDRYLLIAYPDRTYITYTRAKVAVIATAIVSAAIASPMGLFMDVVELKPLCGRSCVEMWPQTAYEKEGKILANFELLDENNSATLSRRTYGLFVALLQLALPTAVTVVCYILISHRLTHQQECRVLGSLLRPEVIQRLTDRRRRTNRMMASMVAAFVLVWLPLNAVNVMRDFGLFHLVVYHGLFKMTFVVCHSIAMTSIIWNPLIYAWYNEAIRNRVLSMFGRWRKRIRVWCAKPTRT